MLQQTSTGFRDIDHQQETKDYVKLYFTGKIDRLIKKKQQQLKQDLDRSYYNTLNCSLKGETKVSGNNMPGDPTGGRATTLAAYHYQLKYTCEFLQQVKHELDNLEIAAADYELLKFHLDCSNKTLTQIYKEFKMSRYSLKKRREELEGLVIDKIGPLLEDYIKKLD